MLKRCAMLQLCLLIAMVNILTNSIRMIFKKPLNIFIICEGIILILIPRLKQQDLLNQGLCSSLGERIRVCTMIAFCGVS